MTDRHGPAAVPVLRSADFGLDDDERDVEELYARFFAQEASLDLVRDAEDTGHDPALWKKLLATGVLDMAVDGAGGGLVPLALAAEQMGARLAPVPLVETATAARALASVGAAASASGSDDIVTVALRPADDQATQLVPAGAVAAAVVAWRDGRLVLVRGGGGSPSPNPWHAPVGRWVLDGSVGTVDVLASGPDAQAAFAGLRRDWKVLTAAALVGVAQGALTVAAEYAKERTAFGVPIGTFQALSHPMADGAIGIETGRRMARRAAWFVDHEPELAPRLAAMALVHAADVANRTTHLAIHVLGGIGFTLEASPQLYFRRAKGLLLVGGDPQRELQVIADESFGPITDG